MKEYLYGTEAISEWKEGSTLVFRGIWEGTTYEDRGLIRTWQPPYYFTYTYYSNFFGLPDLPENYSLLENRLSLNGDFVEIHLTQTRFVRMLPCQEIEQRTK
ncbi:SRPBCC domain-containing protein [Leptospira ognonensis]|nr:SRPBCC domain-containing protein [Leptospira ognonensis]